ncbi:MAG: hypothetical protein GWM98_10480 [Nitrospinaceae bacterium]|nr:hypothetical protein [Nitrospinaceae bacterium]NIR54838.1 hypothetical protein [Nitrospinaceae bacterium]NIS85263.1 hypothetical protein [Nitrospinaceae bacterium]NIT82076.1 hypothetical protein [Nitrospinaceae bacterium]NIU44337.1 hypothetical protein [Nitrospinaceae bacterium]
MKLKSLIISLLFSISVSGTAAADVSQEFLDMIHPAHHAGQIKGSVKSCSSEFNMSGTLVHVPGISVSTRLGNKQEFKLLSVPEGNHSLVFEYGDQILHTVKNVTVRKQTLTSVAPITLCPDNDGDGYNLMADLDDANPAVHPGAKEICDRIDNNGDGVVDEGCSYRKCPKGGNFCLSNWNNSNRIRNAGKSTKQDPPLIQQSLSATTELKP